MPATCCKAVDEFEFIWGSNKFTLGVSIGLVAIDAQFKRIAQVLNAADTACYAAKDAGRNRVVVYQADALLVERQQRRDGMGGPRQAGAGRRTGCSSKRS